MVVPDFRALAEPEIGLIKKAIFLLDVVIND
jgi:hypothetical protein